MAGYTFQADQFCARCILSATVRALHSDAAIPEAEAGSLALAALDVRHGAYSVQNVEILASAGLSRLAEMLGIDPEAPHTFDSDDFPKFFPTSEDDEVCASCGDVIAGTEYDRPEVISARAEGAQSALESLARDLDDSLQAREIMAGAFAADLSPEAIRREVAEIAGRHIDVARGQRDEFAADLPQNYLGTTLA